MKIDLLKGQAPDILLMNALSKHYSSDDLFEKLKLGDGANAEVKLTVNGFEVPFDSIVQNIWEHCETVHDDEVSKEALKLIGLTGMEALQDVIRRAQDDIESHLEKTLREIRKKNDQKVA